MSKTRILMALALLLGAFHLSLPAAQADTIYQIDSSVWGHYQRYLKTIGSTRPGAFAITTDGGASYFVYCEAVQCVAGTTYSHDARQSCEREFGTDCVVFAVRDSIKVQYEIRGAARSGGSSAAPELSPPPMTRIAVSPAIRAEIDQYLRNATAGGRAWALAIAKDGSAVAAANCLNTGGGGYFGGRGYCDLNQGTGQELANKEALKRCGGIDDCVLLYTGQQKAANIDIGGESGAAAPAVAPAVGSAPAEVAAVAPAVPVIEAAAPTPQPAMRVDGAVWGSYQEYLKRIGSTRPGAFAVTKDGEEAYYVWCEQTRCADGGTYGGDALQHCEAEYGKDCTIFALGDRIQVAYEIVGRMAAPATPPPAAPKATPISVSAAVQAEIDRYLNNAKSAGKAWALAIAKDGSAIGTANCPASGSWSGGTACEPVKGSPQELANREAIKRCGGPAACLLLYVGEQKTASIEIAAQ